MATHQSEIGRTLLLRAIEEQQLARRLQAGEAAARDQLFRANAARCDEIVMDTPLSVLILEDRPADAERMAEVLHKAGFAPQWRRVETERDFLAALDQPVDVILADHPLLQYDSVRALEQLQERGLDAPFIIVSGTIGEELAVTLMKQGAADYVWKDRMARLGQAVVHALERKKLLQEKRQVERSLILFRTLLDRTTDFIEVIDPESGRILDVNESACAAHGYTREEYLRLSVPDLQEKFTHWPTPDVPTGAGAPGSTNFEGRHRRKDGSVFPVEVNINLIHLDRDYFVAVVRDITERKQAEAKLRASEERFRRITVNMRDMVAQTDTAGIIQYVSPSNEALIGYRSDQLVGQSAFAFLHPDDRDRGEAMFRTALATRTPAGGEFRFRHADGHYLWLESIGNFILDDAGQVCGAILSSRDITERKKTEEKLRLQGAALESAANTIVITDRQGAITWVNKAFTHLTGYASEEVIGQNPRLFKSGKQDPSFYKELWSTILAGKVWRGELVNCRKDGTLYTDEMTITPVCVNGDGITHFIAIKQDVTERKQTEETLRAEQAKLTAISTAALDAIIMIDSDRGVVFWNPAAERILGYSRSEIMGKNLHQLMAPKRYQPDFDTGLSAFKQTGQGPVVGKVVEVSAIHRDGHELPVELSVSSVRLGDQWCAVGVLRDITERKRSEAEKSRLIAIMEATPDFVGTASIDGRGLYLNRGGRELIGYGVDENVSAIRIEDCHPAWAYRLIKEEGIPEAVRHGYWRGEAALRTRDGREIPVLIVVVAHRSPAGEVECLSIFAHDISERKRAEQLLRQSEEQIRLLLNSTAEAICGVDVNEHCTFANPACLRMLGYTRIEELLGKNMHKVLQHSHPDGRTYLQEECPIARTCREGNSTHVDNEIFWRANGTSFPVEYWSHPIRKEGAFTGAVVTFLDITERKKAEEELRSKTAFLEAQSESSLDGLLVVDDQQNKIFQNRQFASLWQIAQDLLNQAEDEPTLQYVTRQTKDPARFLDRVKYLYAHPDESARDEIELQDGRVMDRYTSPVRGRDGHYYGRIWSFRDITEPKKVQATLEERSRLAALVADVGISLTQEARMQGILQRCTEALVHRLGVAFARIWTLNDAGDTLELQASAGLYTHLDGDHSRVPVGKFKIGLIAQERKPHLTNHVIGDDRVHDQEWARREGMVSFAGHPLIVGGNLRGVMAVFSRQALSEDTLNTLAAVANELALGIERNQAEQALRTLNAELERRVRDRTTQLEAANKELEAFAYSVSHDLRAPLRAIDGFSQALLEDYSDKLADDGQDCLRRVRAASQRMGRLIDEILQLSRLTRSAMSCESLDLSAMAERIMAELRAAEPARQVEFCVAPGLTAKGDPRLLEAALTNLLGNAWKFTSKTPAARIEFGRSDDKERGAFFVRDNGAGFDMAYADRLFGAFQRLHSESEFPGTGIGLATVQRIVRRHGGEVWANGAVGKGATFFFTLGLGETFTKATGVEVARAQEKQHLP